MSAEKRSKKKLQAKGTRKIATTLIEAFLAFHLGSSLVLLAIIQIQEVIKYLKWR